MPLSDSPTLAFAELMDSDFMRGKADMRQQCQNFEPVVVSQDDMLEKIAQLRVAAWQANGEVRLFIANQDIHNDEHEKHGIHVAILYKDYPVASAKLCIHETARECPDPESLYGYEEQLAAPIATLNRLVVHPNFRRKGLSLLLTEFRISVAKQNKCGSIVGVVEQNSRKRQLEAFGFRNLGPTKFRYLSTTESFVYMLGLNSNTSAENVRPVTITVGENGAT